MLTFKHIAITVVSACAFVLPATSHAGGSFGFSINTGPAFYAPPPPPPPVYYAPPPPPPVYYAPTYVYRPYYRPAPAFSFSYHGY